MAHNGTASRTAGGTARGLIAWTVCTALVLAGLPPVARAQTASQAASQTAAAMAKGEADAFSIEQIDALLAPIALYPDELLMQTLMASVYPLDVVAASRWLEAPGNKDLRGAALEKALAPQDWDPSVKSLVVFPQVLLMMNGKLDWTQQLGYVMTVQQQDALGAIQRLRRQALAAGQLATSDKIVVRQEKDVIVIVPAQPQVVYVPVYNPTVVYGTWPYAAYPPVYVPPPPGYVVGNALLAGLAFGVGVAITANLWGWATPRWGPNHVYVNVNRYNTINVNRPPIREPNWNPGHGGYRPPPPGGRPPGGPVGRPAPGHGYPPNGVGRPNVSVPGNTVRPPANMGPNGRPPISTPPGGAQTRPAPQGGAQTRPAPQGGAQTRPAPRPAPMGSLNDGAQARQYSNRGAQSRPAPAPAPARQRAAPTGQRAGAGGRQP